MKIFNIKKLIRIKINTLNLAIKVYFSEKYKLADDFWLPIYQKTPYLPNKIIISRTKNIRNNSIIRNIKYIYKKNTRTQYLYTT